MAFFLYGNILFFLFPCSCLVIAQDRPLKLNNNEKVYKIVRNWEKLNWIQKSKNIVICKTDLLLKFKDWEKWKIANFQYSSLRKRRPHNRISFFFPKTMTDSLRFVSNTLSQKFFFMNSKGIFTKKWIILAHHLLVLTYRFTECLKKWTESLQRVLPFRFQLGSRADVRLPKLNKSTRGRLENN